MARSEPRQGLMPSIVDRLTDPDATAAAWRQGFGWQQIIDSVRRDLEDLLNSHQVYTSGLEDWPESQTSLLTYGLPDFASLSANTPQEREQVAKLLEEIIMRFEPRLRNVRANLVESKNPHERTIGFHIDAQLNVDPAPEVSFETVMELTTGRTLIRSSEGAA